MQRFKAVTFPYKILIQQSGASQEKSSERVQRGTQIPYSWAPALTGRDRYRR